MPKEKRLYRLLMAFMTPIYENASLCRLQPMIYFRLASLDHLVKHIYPMASIDKAVSGQNA